MASQTPSSDSPEHWLERAREAQALAEETVDLEMKQVLLQIAEGYRRIAQLQSKPEASNGA
jgi:hypothetical protein